MRHLFLTALAAFFLCGACEARCHRPLAGRARAFVRSRPVIRAVAASAKVATAPVRAAAKCLR